MVRWNLTACKNDSSSALTTYVRESDGEGSDSKSHFILCIGRPAALP